MEIDFRPIYFVYIAGDDYTVHLKVGITTNLRDMFPGLSPGMPAGDTDDGGQLLYYEQYLEREAAVKRETELAFLSQRKLRKLVLHGNPLLMGIEGRPCPY